MVITGVGITVIGVGTIDIGVGTVGTGVGVITGTVTTGGTTGDWICLCLGLDSKITGRYFLAEKLMTRDILYVQFAVISAAVVLGSFTFVTFAQ